MTHTAIQILRNDISDSIVNLNSFQTKKNQESHLMMMNNMQCTVSGSKTVFVFWIVQ